MSNGKLTLFGPFLSQEGQILEVIAVPGGRLLALTNTPDGVGVVNHSNGDLGAPFSIGDGRVPAPGTAVTAGGIMWLVYEKLQGGFGAGAQQVVETGVVAVEPNSSGGLTATQVGPAYDGLSVVARALAIAADGSLWVALQSKDDAKPSRVDRIWLPPPGKGTQPTWYPDYNSVELPLDWRPERITAATTPSTQPIPNPGFLYLLGTNGRTNKYFLAAIWLAPKASMPRAFPTLRRYEVSLIDDYDVEGIPTDLIRAGDDSAWAVGFNGSSGWMAHRSSASSESWISTDSQRQYFGLVEGPERTNPHGNEYRAMFLVRRFVDSGSDTQSDIETFRGDPQAGLGWTTEPDTHTNQEGAQVQAKIAIERLSRRPDSAGNYWFAYITSGTPGNVYGTGFFTPPKGDPLDQP
jgi:hypothetical protein